MRILLFVLGTVNFVGAVALAASRNDIPDKAFWAEWALTAFGATLATLVVPPLQTWVVDHGERGRRRGLEREDAVRQLLTGALVDVVRANPDLDCTTTGVHAFRVGRRFGLRRPLVRQHQKRLARVKLTFSPPPSGIEWTVGKGLIGRCWETRTNVAVDLRDCFGPYLGSSRAEWDRLDAQTRFGLSFDEFSKTKDSFGWVAAAPILDRQGGYLGCVSLDTPRSAPGSVNIEGIKERLRATAVSVELLLANRN